MAAGHRIQDGNLSIVDHGLRRVIKPIDPLLRDSNSMPDSQRTSASVALASIAEAHWQTLAKTLDGSLKELSWERFELGDPFVNTRHFYATASTMLNGYLRLVFSRLWLTFLFSIVALKLEVRKTPNRLPTVTTLMWLGHSRQEKVGHNFTQGKERLPITIVYVYIQSLSFRFSEETSAVQPHVLFLSSSQHSSATGFDHGSAVLGCSGKNGK
ncbi:hypothetical protein BDZ89DRAFT_1047261 [Hymenopellis radicata]|nr:hypothetical protein BDZ89DRAFT_1047261 [Hymenopellis radicata]